MSLSGIRTIGGEKLPLLPPWKNIKIRAKNIKSKKLLVEERLLRKKKPSSVDSRLRISGMTKGSVIPECIYQESKLLKGESLWIPDKKFRE